MKGHTFVSAALFTLAAGVAGAQTTPASPCPPGTTGPFGVPDSQKATQDACQVAVDVFQVMAPQLGLAMAGGNATLGQGGALGGLGHFSLGIRGNVFRGSLPQVQNLRVSTNGRQQRGSGGLAAIESDERIIGLPTVEAGIGLFKGIPLGVTNVGGLDLLASFAYIPDVHADAIDITTESPWKVGFGARVGLLQESILVPGVSFTWLRRDQPTVTITGNTSDGDTVQVRNLKVKTSAWRVVASKSLLVFGVAAGIGQDDYDSSTEAVAAVQLRGIPGVTGTVHSSPVPLAQKMKRTNMFLDLSFNLPMVKLVGEVGRATGGTVTTYNTFTGKAADAPKVYGSVGVKLGL